MLRLAAAKIIRRFVNNDLAQYEENLELDDPRFNWMNYGLDGDEFGWVRAEDQDWSYQLNLARLTVSGLALDGKRLLDTGSGRGGNCSYLDRYYALGSIVGLDQSHGQVEFCNKHFSSARTRFIQGNAQSMPFGDQSFDVVTNIESACHYEDPKRFYREVFRVLSPGGYFCHSCNYSSPSAVEKRMESTGLRIIRREDITDRVIQALIKNEGRLLQLLRDISKTYRQKDIAHGLHSGLSFKMPKIFNDKHRYMFWQLQRQA